MIYFRDIEHMIRKGQPRPAKTYRAARRNNDRTGARGLALKQKRLALGMSRHVMDWERQQTRDKTPAPAKPAFVQSPRSHAGNAMHKIRCRNGVGRPPRKKA